MSKEVKLCTHYKHDLSAEEADAGNVMAIVLIDKTKLLVEYEAEKIVLWDVVTGVSLFSLPADQGLRPRPAT
jgi:hypothetical protein